MKILVVTPHYLPDGGPGAPLYAMLCEALVLRGHQVTVVSAVPHYPSGRVLPEYLGWRFRCTDENGVHVMRVPIPSLDRSRLLHRLFQLMIFQLGATRVTLSEQYDVILLSNPSLSTGIPLATASILRRRPVVYSIHDVYPNVGVTLGVFRHPAVIKSVGAWERFSLNRAKKVRILSESFLPGVKALGVPDEKIELIYDWVDTRLVHPLPRDNEFAREFNLVDKFVVLYAGNIGLSQGLEHVLTAAEKLAAQTDLYFVFIGDGAGKALLIQDAHSRKLNKVMFLPFQPRPRLPEVLAVADVSLVPLSHGIATQSLPSKIFSILASGRPVIASVDAASDTANLILRSQGGICISPEDPDALANAILKLKADPRERENLGLNGRKFAERYHSPLIAAEKFERLFLQTITLKK